MITPDEDITDWLHEPWRSERFQLFLASLPRDRREILMQLRKEEKERLNGTQTEVSD